MKASSEYMDLGAEELELVSGMLSKVSEYVEKTGATGTTEVLSKLGNLFNSTPFKAFDMDTKQLEFMQGVVGAETRKTLLPKLIEKLQGETEQIILVTLTLALTMALNALSSYSPHYNLP